MRIETRKREREGVREAEEGQGGRGEDRCVRVCPVFSFSSATRPGRGPAPGRPSGPRGEGRAVVEEAPRARPGPARPGGGALAALAARPLLGFSRPRLRKDVLKGRGVWSRPDGRGGLIYTTAHRKDEGPQPPPPGSASVAGGNGAPRSTPGETNPFRAFPRRGSGCTQRRRSPIS